MKKIYTIVVFLLFTASLCAQELNEEVFELLDLQHKGLEQVASLHSEGKDKEALTHLLQYYRDRTGLVHPDIDLTNINISAKEQKWADEALNHQFFVHDGYQPSFHYGDDINWQYWPVVDNELRWQLHRTKWWQPMGKAYYISKDEKYAKEWAYEFMDWIAKNPLVSKPADESKLNEAELNLYKNVRFAWRPLEVSHRIQDQTIQFLLFLNSKHFTPEFLSQFLVNYNKQAEHVMKNYSKQGNHLLFEAQRQIYAGVFFPELKKATEWRKSGIDILNKEIEVQVYDDGGQFELDPHYHLAAINIFAKAIRVADANGFRNEFADSYLFTVEKMIMWTINCHFPDYSNPMFSDAKQDTKASMLPDYKDWAKIFPSNSAIKYMATERKSGSAPANLSTAFKTSGFYIFRNGWQENATQMTLKAGPPAFWHNQPDNGTFELYINGRNFFTDSGSYVYAGSKEVNQQRDWFRQTMVHKTLTINNENLEEMDSKLRLWDVANIDSQVLVYDNQSYKELNHRRSVFFVDQKFFVIVDEASGDAKGNVAVHYQMCEGDMKLDAKNKTATSLFTDNNNVIVQAFSPQKMVMQEEEGWVSYAYRQKTKRSAYAYQIEKKDEKPVRYITVIMPVTSAQDAPRIKASFADDGFSSEGLRATVKVGKKEYKLNYKL